MSLSTPRDGAPPPSDRAAFAQPPSVQAVAWLALVGLAVVGRLWRPEWNGTPLWNATPMAAVALAAGALFPGRLLAASVPVAALLLGNLALPAYGSWTMAGVIVAATAWPVLLGGLLRGAPTTARHWVNVIGGALASSLVFFLATNLAHWGLSDDYPRTLAGLGACYVAALPFYRWMPVGDVAWTVVVFGGLAGLTAGVPRLGGRLSACPVQQGGVGRDKAGRALPLD